MAFDSSAYPYDTVVRITDVIGGTEYQGSGVLISPDEVLTASHVVYIAGVGTANDVSVTPAYNDGTAPFGSAFGTLIHYYPIKDAGDSISNAASQDDYAVIHLSSSFPTLGTMGLQANYAGGAVTVAGYPASAGGSMVASAQTVFVDPNYTLLDGTALGEGSSGGPVFIGGASDPAVVGIVSSELNQNGYDTLLTAQAVDQIEQWVASDDGTPSSALDPSVTVSGSHGQYVIADSDGSLYYQDLVANRNGSATLPGIDEIDFSDGVGRFDATGNAEDVARLYGVALGRDADLAGLNAWTHAIDSNALQLGSVAMAFVGSAEFQTKYGSLSNQQFVSELYQNALGRAGDAAGVAAWTGALDDGVSRGAVLLSFSDSIEYRQDTLASIGDKDMAEVYRIYQAAFDRSPDAAGLQGWVGALDAGATPLQVAEDISMGAEFSAMYGGLSASGQVNLLYENALHRAGDSGGVAAWAGELQSGVPIGQVLLGFADSLESRVDTAGVTHDGWVFVAS